MPFSIFKKRVVGINIINKSDSITGEYPSSSKNKAENTMANKQARNLSTAVRKDFFREGWIQSMAKMPAVATLLIAKNCAIANAIGVATAVLSVL